MTYPLQCGSLNGKSVTLANSTAYLFEQATIASLKFIVSLCVMSALLSSVVIKKSWGWFCQVSLDFFFSAQQLNDSLGSLWRIDCTSSPIQSDYGFLPFPR